MTTYELLLVKEKVYDAMRKADSETFKLRIEPNTQFLHPSDDNWREVCKLLGIPYKYESTTSLFVIPKRKVKKFLPYVGEYYL